MAEADKDCEDCQGSGLIECERVTLGRPYMKNGHLVQDVIGHGDWHMTQCPCVGDSDD